jgi:site-specific recombinase XerD
VSTWTGAAAGISTRSPPAAHIELYVRWMQEKRRFKPSTVSRRTSVVTGFYRTCVHDGILVRSPAEHVRRPSVGRGAALDLPEQAVPADGIVVDLVGTIGTCSTS